MTQVRETKHYVVRVYFDGQAVQSDPTSNLSEATALCESIKAAGLKPQLIRTKITTEIVRND